MAFAEKNHSENSWENLTPSEWIAAFLEEASYYQELVDRCRKCGETDEEIKAFLEGV